MYLDANVLLGLLLSLRAALVLTIAVRRRQIEVALLDRQAAGAPLVFLSATIFVIRNVLLTNNRMWKEMERWERRRGAY